MLLIFRSKRLLPWVKVDHMKKEDIDHQACPPTQVYFPLIYICIELNNMIGVVVVIRNITHSVMVNANGLWLDADQSTLMFPRAVTISFVIVRWVQMRHSAMEHISTWSNGHLRIIEVSGASLQWLLGGVPWAIGCSLSTSDSFQQQCHRLLHIPNQSNSIKMPNFQSLLIHIYLSI